MIGVESTGKGHVAYAALPPATGPISELIRGLLASPAEAAETLSPAAAAAASASERGCESSERCSS